MGTTSRAEKSRASVLGPTLVLLLAIVTVASCGPAPRSATRPVPKSGPTQGVVPDRPPDKVETH